MVLAAVGALAFGEALAADYPARPVRWLVGFAPGASNDIIARIIAASLTETLGQQVIVDNRAGAARSRTRGIYLPWRARARAASSMPKN